MPILDILSKKSYQIIFWDIESFSNEKVTDFYLPKIDLKIIEKTKGLYRKNERLASRLSAQEVLGNEYNGIDYLENGKPFLINSPKNISISHSKNIVVVLISTNEIIGIDIQQQSEKIRRVAKRVFNENEMLWAGDNLDRLTKLWTIKEAVFKAAQTKGLDFREEIVISPKEEDFLVTVTSNSTSKNYTINTLIFKGYQVAYTV